MGKTWLAYHLAWIYSDLGLSVIGADLDPQANLTSMFLEDDRLEWLWDETSRATIYSALRPILEGPGDVVSSRQPAPAEKAAGPIASHPIAGRGRPLICTV